MQTPTTIVTAAEKFDAEVTRISAELTTLITRARKGDDIAHDFQRLVSVATSALASATRTAALTRAFHQQSTTTK